jgi:hypothetical protein
MRDPRPERSWRRLAIRPLYVAKGHLISEISVQPHFQADRFGRAKIKTGSSAPPEPHDERRGSLVHAATRQFPAAIHNSCPIAVQSPSPAVQRAPVTHGQGEITRSRDDVTIQKARGLAGCSSPPGNARCYLLGTLCDPSVSRKLAYTACTPYFC